MLFGDYAVSPGENPWNRSRAGQLIEASLCKSRDQTIRLAYSDSSAPGSAVGDSESRLLAKQTNHLGADMVLEIAGISG